MAESLHGKVVAITGASSGIGEATAVAAAQAGAAVALGARRADRLQALAEKITSGGGRAAAIECDVAVEGSANDFVRRAHSELGGLDILVNNAGVMLLGPIDGADTGEWRRMVEVNVLGLMYCTHAALPLMREGGGGHIVNVSSVAGRTARAGVGAYNATKWAVTAFSEALRQEALHANIRVTCIEPGMVATELQGHSTHPLGVKGIERMQEAIKQPLVADDIAEAILYAISQPGHVSVNEILVRPSQQPN